MNAAQLLVKIASKAEALTKAQIAQISAIVDGGEMAPKEPPDARFLTPEEAAMRLGVSRVTIWRQIKCGAIKARRLGRALRIPESEISATSTP